MRFNNSKILYNKALNYIAGGVSSNFRLYEPAEVPLFFEKALGSYMWDVDGNRYIDYVMGLGPNLFGHGPNFIKEAVNKGMSKGFIYSGQHELEISVAEQALKFIPMQDSTVRFASSGTEIVQLAIRLIRSYTGKNKFIKFEGHYHGWADNVCFSVNPKLDSSGSNMTPIAVPDSSGIDINISENILICQWNDIENINYLFKKYQGEIGGVIMEPIMGNTNVVMPLPGYLNKVKELCIRESAILCYDEIITGFRVAAGGAQEMLNIIPDLATYAKSIAGGFPLAMLVGKREIMNNIGNGNVVHGGSFNSNLMSISAAHAVLQRIKQKGPEFYNKLNGLGLHLMNGLRDVARKSKINLKVNGPGSFFSIYFSDKQNILNWRDHKRNVNDIKYQTFAKAMLLENIRLSSIGRIHICSTHTEEDIEITIQAAHTVLKNF